VSSTRGILGNIALMIASTCVFLLVIELGVRGLQASGRLEVLSSSALVERGDALESHNARLIRSSNPLLVHEFDVDDPLINALGARGPEIAREKPPHARRIAVLGDSVAFGLGVPTEQTFSTQLEKLINSENGSEAVQVLNFGVNGYGTAEELELYKTRVAALEPDILILGYVLNDPYPPEVMVAAVGDLLRDAARLDRISRVSQLLGWAWLRWKNLKRLAVGHVYYRAYADPGMWRRVTRSMAEFAELGRQRNLPVLVVIFPLLVDYSEYSFRDLHDQVRQLLEQERLPHIDLTRAYAAQGADRLRLRENDETHPNALGHSIAANEIHAWLTERGLLQQGAVREAERRLREEALRSRAR
jgi:lysophospholipase L1-like esterase